MDKVKIYLAWLKKHHFWVLSAIVIITALTGTLLASSRLSTVYSTQKQKIESEFKELGQVTSIEFHPNGQWKDGVTGLTQNLGKGVKKAWADVYNEQKTVLIWPDVNANFSRYMQEIGPKDEIPLEFREDYFNYIKKEFQRLLEIVDSQKHDVKDPRGGTKASEVTDTHDYKVIWEQKNQQDIDSALDFASVPTDHEMRNTQEDLWVYRSLLTIIATLNEKATGHYNAKVKRIDSLLIGKGAAEAFTAGIAPGRIEPPAGAPRVTGPVVRTEPLPQAPTPAPGAPGAALDEGRYVDDKGKPLAGGATATAEFKRMPVFLRLVMDQREISRLLVECANSPLPVEIRQLRLNPGMAASGGKAAGGKRTVPAGAKGADMEQGPFDVTIELHGIVYIFNPPSVATFGVAADVDPAAAPAEPVAAAPAGSVAPAAPADDAAAEAAAEEDASDEAAMDEATDEAAPDSETTEPDATE